MKYSVNAAGCPDAFGAASKATTAGRLVFVSAQLPVEDDGQTVVGGDVRAQARRVIELVGVVLAEVGLDFSDVAKTTVYLRDLDDAEAFDEVYGELLDRPFPARAIVGARDLPLGARVQMDAIACR